MMNWLKGWNENKEEPNEGRETLDAKEETHASEKRKETE